MCVFGSIDCAGILKLRNADIELRKGETDIGRKNTRVRLVFRVHIPESSGRIISLQAASNPIECCKYLLRFATSPSLATTIVLLLCARIGKGKVLCTAWVGATICVTCGSLPICAPFPETSLGSRWFFTVLRAHEGSKGLWGFCRFYLLVCCCSIILVRSSFLGGGSQCMCVYRDIYAFSLFVHELPAFLEVVLF